MDNELKNRIISSIILLPLSLFFIFQGSLLFICFLAVLFLITVFEWTRLSKNKNILQLLGFIFLLISFYSTFLLRKDYGFNIFIFILLICVSTDLGGYFFGKILKGPKLTKISPNKTISGTFGSFILPLITGLIYNHYSDLDLNTIFLINNFDLLINFKIELILVIFVVSLISQCGDLVISYFKRLVNIKDTGNLLPGHGGILDRIDGLIFVLPIFLIFILK